MTDTDREARLEEIRDMRARAYAVWREGANSWDATKHIEWLLSEIDRLREALNQITLLGPETHSDPVQAVEAAAEIADRALHEGDEDG